MSESEKSFYTEEEVMRRLRLKDVVDDITGYDPDACAILVQAAEKAMREHDCNRVSGRFEISLQEDGGVNVKIDVDPDINNLKINFVVSNEMGYVHPGVKVIDEWEITEKGCRRRPLTCCSPVGFLDAGPRKGGARLSRKAKVGGGLMAILLIASVLYNIFGIGPPEGVKEKIVKAHAAAVATVEFCDSQLQDPTITPELREKVEAVKEKAEETKSFLEQLCEVWDIPLPAITTEDNSPAEEPANEDDTQKGEPPTENGEGEGGAFLQHNQPLRTIQSCPRKGEDSSSPFAACYLDNVTVHSENTSKEVSCLKFGRSCPRMGADSVQLVAS